MNFLPSFRQLLLLSVAGFILSIDQLTKQMVINRFHYGESIPIIGDLFSLTYVRNPGAAFGILSQWDSSLRVPFFIFVPLLALLVVAYLFRKMSEKDTLMALALSFVVGGAIGNLVDRVSYGYVIDFLDFHWGFSGPHFPAFNIADIAICVGVGLLLLDMVLKEKIAKKESEGHTTTETN